MSQEECREAEGYRQSDCLAAVEPVACKCIPEVVRIGSEADLLCVRWPVGIEDMCVVVICHWRSDQEEEAV